MAKRRRPQSYRPQPPKESEAENLQRWIDGNEHVARRIESSNPEHASRLRMQAQKWRERLQRLLETKPGATNYGGPPQ